MKKIAQYGLLSTTTMLVILTISTLDSFDSSLNFLLLFNALAIIACIVLIPKEDFNKLVFKDKWFNN